MCVVHGVVRGERRKWGGGGRMEWVKGCGWEWGDGLDKFGPVMFVKRITRWDGTSRNIFLNVSDFFLGT